MDLNSDEYFQFFSNTIKIRENFIILNEFQPLKSKFLRYEYFNEKNENNDLLFSKHYGKF